MAPEGALSVIADTVEVFGLPAVEVEWKEETLSGQELQAELEGVEGWAMVSLKHPAAEAIAANLSTQQTSHGQTRVVGVKAALDEQAVRGGLRYLEAQGVRIERYLPNLGLAIVQLDPSEAANIAQSPHVEYIEPRRFGWLNAEQVHWSLDTVAAPVAWSASAGQGAKVLVIDSEGYHRGRPDLPVLPYSNCAGPWGGCTASYSSAHATMVLGTLAMIEGNGIGGVGVAPGLAASDVYLYTACGAAVSGDPQTVECRYDEAVAGIDRGISWGVDVINMSLGYWYSSAMAEAAARAEAADIVFVASAGNNMTLTEQYPAAFSTVLGVSGINPNGTFANPSAGCIGYSNSGSHVAISAPFQSYTTTGPSSYATRCGTSFSAPMVAGAAAILRSLDPSLAADEVRGILTSSAVDHGPPGWDNEYGHGVLNVAAAVLTVDPMTASISGSSTIAESGNWTWYSDVDGGFPPFTYEWRKDGVLVGTGSSLTLGVSSADNPGFDLHLTVYGAGGTEESAALPIVVWINDGPGCEPGDIFCE